MSIGASTAPEAAFPSNDPPHPRVRPATASPLMAEDAAAPQALPAGPAPDPWHRRCAIILPVALLALYLPLVNSYWTPAGDGEIFLSAARSLLKGQGFTFNGIPVNIVPPGWPAILSLVMRVSDSFLVFKLLTMACSIGALTLSYFILRRWFSARLSLASCLLVGILGEMYPLNAWLLSDPAFMLATAAAVLLALRIGEGKGGVAAVIVLVLLCTAAITIRWAGLFNCALIAGALLRGQVKPVRWLPFAGAAAVVVVVLATFFGWMFFLNRATERAREAAMIRPVVGPPKIDPAYDAKVQVSIEPERGREKGKGAPAQARTTRLRSYRASLSEYARRLMFTGEWVGTLVCKPLRLAKSLKPFKWGALALGWFLLIPLLFTVFRQCRRREWLWLGMLAYCGVLVLIWTINCRYLLPMAPLIFAAILAGFRDLIEVARERMWVWGARFWRLTMICFVAGVLLSSSALYAVDVKVAQAAGDNASAYYDDFEAGVHKELIGAAAYIRKRSNPNIRVAVSGRYQNINTLKAKPMSSRAMVMLSEREILAVPLRLGGPPDKELSKWLAERKASYYLYQPPMSPWRVWHFRMPWLQEKMTKQPVEPIDGRWRLARLNDKGKVIEWVKLPDVAEAEDLVRHVPGLRR